MRQCHCHRRQQNKEQWSSLEESGGKTLFFLMANVLGLRKEIIPAFVAGSLKDHLPTLSVLVWKTLLLKLMVITELADLDHPQILAC